MGKKGLFDIFHLFHILLWRVLHSNGSEMPGCDITCLYYFGSDIEADPQTPRCITQHPLFETICLQREVLETAIVGLCQVRGMRTPREL